MNGRRATIGDATLPPLSAQKAEALIRRIDSIALYMHAYSLHLNFYYGGFTPSDLLDFAARHKHRGVKIHLLDGEDASLGNMDAAGLSRFGQKAKQLGLDVHLEISETEVASLRKAVFIGQQTGATSIRCYPRYEGRVSTVIARTIDDLRHLKALDPQTTFRFTLEQHEDLTGTELVKIVEAVGNPNLSLMFDFTNMINAFERPLDALRVMAPHVTDVHIKDAIIIEEKGGWAQQCCRSGDGHIPQARLLVELLLLGQDQPQVRAFGLEEEVGYHSPPYRFVNEELDPYIPHRPLSETKLGPEANLEELLAQERSDAKHLCSHIDMLLKQLRDHATLNLGAI
ncbi:MAG: TIM barrel protein [Sulfitobacter sp.]